MSLPDGREPPGGVSRSRGWRVVSSWRSRSGWWPTGSSRTAMVPAWVGTMSAALAGRGYATVIPFDWAEQSQTPGAADDAGAAPGHGDPRRRGRVRRDRARRRPPHQPQRRGGRGQPGPARSQDRLELPDPGRRVEADPARPAPGAQPPGEPAVQRRPDPARDDRRGRRRRVPGRGERPGSDRALLRGPLRGLLSAHALLPGPRDPLDELPRRPDGTRLQPLGRAACGGDPGVRPDGRGDRPRRGDHLLSESGHPHADRRRAGRWLGPVDRRP